MSLHIREFVESDRPALQKLYVASRAAAFPWLASSEFQLEDFDRDTREERVIVAFLGVIPVGFASVWEPDSFLHNLFVHPDFLRRGIGRALVERSMSYFKGPATLKCLLGNSSAHAFYLHLGWHVTGYGESSDGRYYLMTAGPTGA
ncbi:MAG: GNAT family N-acetyltransferase [Pseudomonadota bacterium]